MSNKYLNEIPGFQTCTDNNCEENYDLIKQMPLGPYEKYRCERCQGLDRCKFCDIDRINPVNSICLGCPVTGNKYLSLDKKKCLSDCSFDQYPRPVTDLTISRTFIDTSFSTKISMTKICTSCPPACLTCNIIDASN
jgi:hypothetical protein